MEHQKFEIEIQEPIAVIKQKFHDLITSYSEAVGSKFLFSKNEVTQLLMDT